MYCDIRMDVPAREPALYVSVCTSVIVPSEQHCYVVHLKFTKQVYLRKCEIKLSTWYLRRCVSVKVCSLYSNKLHRNLIG